jgi:hypothetical protein
MNRTKLLTLSETFMQLYPNHNPLVKVNEKINPKKIISIAQERDSVTGLLILTVYYIA